MLQFHAIDLDSEEYWRLCTGVQTALVLPDAGYQVGQQLVLRGELKKGRQVWMVRRITSVLSSAFGSCGHSPRDRAAEDVHCHLLDCPAMTGQPRATRIEGLVASHVLVSLNSAAENDWVQQQVSRRLAQHSGPRRAFWQELVRGKVAIQASA